MRPHPLPPQCVWPIDRLCCFLRLWDARSAQLDHCWGLIAWSMDAMDGSSSSDSRVGQSTTRQNARARPCLALILSSNAWILTPFIFSLALFSSLVGRLDLVLRVCFVF
jgi:hypothetical protein